MDWRSYVSVHFSVNHFQLNNASILTWLFYALCAQLSRCIAVATLIAANIVLIGRVRKVIPVFFYTWMTITIHVCMMSVLSCLIEGSTWSMREDGLWGWFNPRYAAIIIAFGGFFGWFAMVGRNFCIKYMDSVVVSTVALLSPILTGILSYVFGLEGTLVWIESTD
jgi:drug/metabolite transporter (DMT)-like permease